MVAKDKSAAKPAGKKRGKKPKEKPEVASPDSGMSLLMGDNMPPKRDVMYHYETILGLMEKASAAASRVSDAKKKAKEAGVDVPALMATKKMMNMDPLDMAVYLRQTAMALAELGAPIQLSLYEPKYGSIEEQAATEGWNDGINAKDMNVARWPVDAPGGKEYARRWNDAQAENASKIGKTDEQ